MTRVGRRPRPPGPAGNELQRLERSLARALRSRCPSPHTLGEYRMGLLDPPLSEGISRHLEVCLPCRAEARLLDGFLEPEGEELSPDAPEPAGKPGLRELRLHWQDALAGLAAAGGLPTAGTAGGRSPVLAAGLRGAPAPASLPSPAPGSVSSLGVSFPSDQGVVALQARPASPGRYDLLVLVTLLEGDPGNLPVWLRRARAAVASTRTDSVGNAVFARLPAGTYDLAVQWGSVRFWVTGIRLGPAAAEEEADAPTR